MFAPKHSSGHWAAKTSLGTVSQADLNKLLYRTSSAPAQEHALARKKEVPETENFSDIHFIGARETRHMPFRHKKAPLLGREACSSSSAFIEHPNEQAMENTIFSTGKHKTKITTVANPGGTGFTNTKDMKSESSSNFNAFSRRQMREAKSPTTKPRDMRTNTITNVKELVETRPRSHHDFIGYNTQNLMSTGVIVLGTRGKAEPKGHLGFVGGMESPTFRTEAQEIGMTRSGSSPALTYTEGFFKPRMFSSIPVFQPGLGAGPPAQCIMGACDMDM